MAKITVGPGNGPSELNKYADCISDDSFPDLSPLSFIKSEENNYYLTTAPLTGELMRHYFKDKSITYLIDVENSTLKNDKLLTYLVNIGISTEIYFSENISYEDFASLLAAWFNLEAVYHSKVLRDLAGCVILTHLGVSEEAMPYRLTIPFEYIQRFASDDRPVIEKWVTFLDSTEVFVYADHPRYSDTILPHERYPTIDDPDYIGLNIACMYLAYEFIVAYESLSRTKGQQYFFKAQYTRFMFDNRHIIEYIRKPYNPISMVAEAIMRGYLLFQDFTDIDPDNREDTEPFYVDDILTRAYAEPVPLKYPPDITPKP